MADLTEVYSALQKADAAGDTAGAKQLADYIRSQTVSTGDSSKAPVSQPSGWDQFLRKTALGGRAIGEGVMSTLSLPNTISTLTGNLMARGINAVAGSNIPMEQPWIAGMHNAMTSAGAPAPETPGENFGYAATQGVAGALTGAGALGGLIGSGTSVPNMIRAGTSGLTGSTAAEGARQGGLPGWAQFGAGLIGGSVPALVEGGANVIGNMARPFTSKGQEQIAANMVAGQASDPVAAAQNMRNAPTFVPGSEPTTGEVANDMGLIRLQKALANNNPVPFAENASRQNAARQDYLTGMAGTEKDLNAAVSARDSQANALYGAARQSGANSGPLNIGSLIDRPAIKSALDGAKATAANFGETVDETNPVSLLHWAKMNLDGKISSAVRAGDNTEVAALSSAKDALLKNIESISPEYAAARGAYAQASVPIDQMTALQGLQSKASSTLFDNIGDRPVLSPAMFSRNLDNAIADEGSRLNPDQLTKLEALRKDLQRSQQVQLIKASGSDTIQNASSAQIIGAGDGGLSAAVANPISRFYKMFGTDERIRDVLRKAMLDPNYGASLIDRAQVQNPMLQRISQGIAPYAQGSISALGQIPARGGLPGGPVGIPYLAH